MNAPAAKLTNRQRAGIIASRAANYAVNVGVGSGMRRYRPEQWSTGKWERAYASGTFDYLSEPYELPRYGVLLGYLRMYPGKPAILDIGCGTGLLRRLLAGDDFTTYSGIDISAEAIRKARPLVDSRTSFGLGDALTSPLAHADVVVLNEVLSYFARPGELLERVASLVNPGGCVLASIYRHGGDRALWRLLDATFERVATSRVRPAGNPYNRRGFHVSWHRARDAGPA
jgi:2-polyprenyl-6-hydroxyphenyl methylase/3-demethylubiquinone-9 3-methyltransferase